ncbi:MAG: hypothetical protein ABI621_05255 [Chloroflexota bacterium]
MRPKSVRPIVSFILSLILILPACSSFSPQPAPVHAAEPIATSTHAATPTVTLLPTSTPRPTSTPNVAATQRRSDLQAEVQSYFDRGFLESTEGTFKELDDFSDEWAQLGWYELERIGMKASDFVLSGHFKWSSAYQNADTYGCGYVFSLQENRDHYALFLDRSKVLFLITSDGYGRISGPTRGTGRVKFGNPAEADFTAIVKGNYVYALVDNEVIGEYTLSQSRPLTGDIALTVLSGTNKDYGTRCEMTNLHLWIPN